MSGITQEEALRQADALVGEALRETEARCAVLGKYVSDCDRKRSTTADWSAALRELSALHAYRGRLLRRRELIRQALDCAVGESPAKSPLTPAPDRAAVRTQRQIQIQGPARQRLSAGAGGTAPAPPRPR